MEAFHGIVPASALLLQCLPTWPCHYYFHKRHKTSVHFTKAELKLYYASQSKHFEHLSEQV